MIRSFANPETEQLFRGRRPKKLPNQIHRIALRKLLILDAADNLNDLQLPPGNHLEKLKGNRSGQHSIRINDQWRICFIWQEVHAHSVEIIDYH